MKSKMTVVVRVLLGLLLAFGGIAYLSGMVPPPPPETIPEKLRLFNQGLESSGYFMKLLKITETVCGLMLISGFFVPLALLILAPIVINIFFVHVFLAPETLVVAVLMGAAMIYLSFFAEPYASRIKPLFRK